MPQDQKSCLVEGTTRDRSSGTQAHHVSPSIDDVLPALELLSIQATPNNLTSRITRDAASTGPDSVYQGHYHYSYEPSRSQGDSLLPALDCPTGYTTRNTDASVPRTVWQIGISSSTSNDGLDSEDEEPSTPNLKEPALSIEQSSFLSHVVDQFVGDIELAWILPEQGFRSRSAEHDAGEDGQESSPSDRPEVASNTAESSKTRSGSNANARKRRSTEPFEDDEDDRENPGASNYPSSYFLASNIKYKFSCPYRKHNVHKYNVRSWRSCALTSFESVARIKTHLYRQHRTFQCLRCKVIFETRGAMERHNEEPLVCDFKIAELAEGLTDEMVQWLKSRKRSCRAEPQTYKWTEMYMKLFPGEQVPEPWYEEVQEDRMPPQEFQRTQDFKMFLGLRLPRYFASAVMYLLEHESLEIRPLDARLHARLESILRECHDQVIREYQSLTASNKSLPECPSSQSSPPEPASSLLPFRWIESSGTAGNLDAPTPAECDLSSVFLLPGQTLDFPEQQNDGMGFLENTSWAPGHSNNPSDDYSSSTLSHEPAWPNSLALSATQYPSCAPLAADQNHYPKNGPLLSQAKPEFFCDEITNSSHQYWLDFNENELSPDNFTWVPETYVDWDDILGPPPAGFTSETGPRMPIIGDGSFFRF